MSSYLIDTHCHLHDREWYTPEQAEACLKEAHTQNVQQIIVIGTDPVDSENACNFANSHQNVFWTYGIHPENAGGISIGSRTSEEAILSLRESSELTSENEAARHPQRRDDATVCPERSGIAYSEMRIKSMESIVKSNLVAIGEIGLDYHYEGYDRTAQIQLFEQMLQLARDLQLPVSLHIRERDAFADAWSILDNFPELEGVVHSFTGSKQELKRALSRNFYIGVNGLATYSTLPLPPLEKMLLETDAPFLTPIPFRGTMNKPGYVSYVAAYLAKQLGVAEVNLAEQTTQNARQLFKFGDTGLRQS